MDSGLYPVLTTCPICEKSFNAIKVKSAALKLDSMDEDFCMHYKGINSILYDPWVCVHCGHAGFESTFEPALEREKVAIRKLCLMKFTDDPSKNPFELTDFHKKVSTYVNALSSEGERNNEAAILAFEILLINLETRNAPPSLKGRALLRIGWIYRFMKDPKELDYLKQAANCYANTFLIEPLPIGKFDSATCAYLVGELSRRTGNLKDAVEWLGRALRSPRTPETANIIEKARDQIQVAKSSPDYEK